MVFQAWGDSIKVKNRTFGDILPRIPVSLQHNGPEVGIALWFSWNFNCVRLANV